MATVPGDILSEVKRAALRELEEDRIDLPAMPMAAVRTFQLLADPDYRVSDVAALIESDPLLTAQLLRLLRSPAFSGGGPITSIQACVARLGAMELRLFLFETSARRLLESSDPHISRFCQGLWEHSLAVATYSREIARAHRPQDAEMAYLTGLLHDVGKPLMAAMLVAAEQRLLGTKTTAWISPDEWLTFILANHRAVGLALARKWQLPELVGDSIRDSGEYDADEPRSLANAVRLGNAAAKHDGFCVGEVDQDEIQSLIFVGQQLFGLDDGVWVDLRGRVHEYLSGRIS